MKSRKIDVSHIGSAVTEACLKANFSLRPDARLLLNASLQSAEPARAKHTLKQLIENYRIAEEERLPLCQDCGYVAVFAEIGQDVEIAGGPLAEAIHSGVNAAYQGHGLRHSIIADALLAREEFETDEPASIHLSIVPGNALKITVMPKGGGSDNAGRLAMLRPTAGREEIIKFVLDTIATTGAGACPPLFVGVGVGGSFDSVALLSKKALLRRFDTENPEPELADLESQLLSRINDLNIGPAGLGGTPTALGVSILTAPAHMACLPLAVNVGCNSLRSAEVEIR